MIHLQNIHYENGIISCEYCPENCGEYGMLAYNWDTKSVVDAKKTKLDVEGSIYIEKVLNQMCDFCNRASDIPKEYFLMIL